MPWGLFALVFVISVAVGAGVAARKQRRKPPPPPPLPPPAKDMN